MSSIKLDYSDFKGHVNLGLCCINTVLRKSNIFCSRKMIRKNFSLEKAQDLALKNVKDICKLIEWNYKNKIKCLRLSSEIFPRFTDSEIEPYTIDFAKDELKKAGDLAKKYDMRILMHPGQYNQVGAPTTKVFNSTILDLSHHADILDVMGIDENGVLIVHGGGTYNDKEKTIDRWISQFFLLPDKVKKRLVIENCEYQYNVKDVLKISKACNIPVVFDFHHYYCYEIIHSTRSNKNCIDCTKRQNSCCDDHKEEEDEEDNEEEDEKEDIKNKKLIEYIYRKEYGNDILQKDWIIPEKELLLLMKDIIASWGNRKIVMHISNQGEGRIGHHSDYIEELPDLLYDILEKYDINIDLEVEAKMKEQSILKLYKTYPELF